MRCIPTTARFRGRSNLFWGSDARPSSILASTEDFRRSGGELRNQGVTCSQGRGCNYCCKNTLIRYLAVFLALALVGEGCAHTQDKGDFIRTVQGAYHSLPKKGISELQCSVAPDWAAILRQEMKAEVKPDNAGLNLLNGVRFWVSVGQTRSSRTHRLFPRLRPSGNASSEPKFALRAILALCC